MDKSISEKKMTFRDFVRALVTKDEDIPEKLDEPKTPTCDDDENAVVSVEAFHQLVAQNAKEHAAMAQRIAALEQQLSDDPDDQNGDGSDVSTGDEEIDPENGNVKTTDRIRSKDSSGLSQTFSDTMATAEIIAPGIKMPTFDSRRAAKDTVAQLCALRKSALRIASRNHDSADIVESVLGGRRLNTVSMSCNDARTVFDAVGAMVAAQNNSNSVSSGKTFNAVNPSMGRLQKPSDLNRLWEEQNQSK
jgi:hypothetical protein